MQPITVSTVCKTEQIRLRISGAREGRTLKNSVQKNQFPISL